MVKCLNCEQETSNPKFCSRSCSTSINNRLSPKKKSKEYNCKTCAKPVAYRRQYCQACNPNTQDWSVITVEQLQKKRKYQTSSRIRSLARAAYHKYAPYRCLICDYDKHIEVAHIKSIDSFSKTTVISVINDPSNLMGLCRNCHWEFDNGLIPGDKIKGLIPLEGIEPSRIG